MPDLNKLAAELTESASAIEAERARAAALFVSIGDGAITTDEQGKINRINAVASKILGFSELEVIGKWFPKVIAAENMDGEKIGTINRPITRAILSGAPVSERCYYYGKNGAKIPVAITVSPILLDDKPIGAIEVFRDISKELEIDQMKSEFISLASHQLRTPLTSIMTYSHMLAEGYAGALSADQEEYMNTILDSIHRMGELISTLLNIARLDAGRMAVSPVSVVLPELAATIVKESALAAAAKKVKLTLETEPNLPAVNTDPLLYREVIANLISNAVKYTPEGGQVVVSLSTEGEEIVCEVTDNGYGIPEAEQARIFSKFYRGTNIMPKVPVGTGLGLYLVKSLVETLSGRIWFKSNEGKGTSFYVALPKQGSVAKSGTTTLEEMKEA